jgi:hypothetical protein
MPAIVYGRAFVLAQDKRLIDLVATIETNVGPLVDTYVTSVHDVYLWVLRHTSGAGQATALGLINAAYGATYDATKPWLGPIPAVP